jgi:hypothetical protein
MWLLSYRPEVEDDVINAVAWYDDKRVGLGDEFLAEYLQAIQRVFENPILFAVAKNGLRPCLLKRFSYIIHFDVLDRQILIVALMGSSRDESVFENRNG